MYHLNKFKPVWLIVITIQAFGCNFSTGFKKQFGSGLSFSYDGFRVRNVVLVGPGNRVMDNSQVQLNSQIAMTAVGISNYELRNGKAFPGMALMVTDKDGLAVISEEDLFPGTDGYPPENAGELRANITIANPMIAGQTYHVKMRVWDKVKPGNELRAETDLIVR